MSPVDVSMTPLILSPSAPQVTGFPAAVKDQILKLASINLCPNLSGQICCTLMMNPPQVSMIESCRRMMSGCVWMLCQEMKERHARGRHRALSAGGCSPSVSYKGAICDVFQSPQPGEPSYEQYMSEKRSILDSLKRRAELLVGR
jgi:hypothetical protein